MTKIVLSQGNRWMPIGKGGKLVKKKKEEKIKCKPKKKKIPKTDEKKERDFLNK